MDNLPGLQIPMDEAKIKLFFLALDTGVFLSTALAYAAIPERTFAVWVEAGRTQPDGPYAEFVSKLDAVMARAEMQLVYAIKDHFERPGGWQAAAWLLKARYPTRWGGKDVNLDEAKKLGQQALPSSEQHELPGLTDSELERIISQNKQSGADHGNE